MCTRETTIPRERRAARGVRGQRRNGGIRVRKLPGKSVDYIDALGTRLYANVPRSFAAAERMTWTAMREIDEENANELKHSGQKNEIANEFEQIKKQVTRAYYDDIRTKNHTIIELF